MTHGYTDEQVVQMIKNVAETGSTMRKYRYEVSMPVYGWINGTIEVEALTEEDAFKMAQDAVGEDSDCVDWCDDIMAGDYDANDCTVYEEAEEINILAMTPVETGV